MNRFYAVVVILAIAAVVFAASTFTVDMTERAIKLELGEVVEAEYEPGLHFKIPFYQTVYRFEDQILMLDSEPTRILTSRKKNLIVDSYVMWEIVDSVAYFQSTGGSRERAEDRLHAFVQNQLFDEIGERTIQQVVSTDRREIMRHVQRVIDERAEDLGINIVDVRIEKVELPEEVLEAVYARMRQERLAVAARYRAEGREQARRIRAEAKRRAAVIAAKAYRKAQRIRGEGDARAAEIYARAYSKAPAFFAFYRSLQAYEEAFKGSRDALVLKPDSEFFEFFEDTKGDFALKADPEGDLANEAGG